MRAPLGANCDSIEVSLALATSPYTIMYTTKNVINSTGNGVFTFPGAVQGGNYYIVVRHRNSIETWSGAAIAFPSVSNTFDFSTAITQAFGSNLVNVGSSKYAIRSGDINQDDVIDHTDVMLLEGSLTGMPTGYQVNDLTGDNLVESTDYSLVETNSKSSITVKKP